MVSCFAICLQSKCYAGENWKFWSGILPIAQLLGEEMLAAFQSDLSGTNVLPSQFGETDLSTTFVSPKFARRSSGFLQASHESHPSVECNKNALWHDEPFGKTGSFP